MTSTESTKSASGQFFHFIKNQCPTYFFTGVEAEDEVGVVVVVGVEVGEEAAVVTEVEVVAAAEMAVVGVGLGAAGEATRLGFPVDASFVFEASSVFEASVTSLELPSGFTTPFSEEVPLVAEVVMVVFEGTAGVVSTAVGGLSSSIVALWSGTNKNRDISTGPLPCPFARSLASLVCLLMTAGFACTLRCTRAVHCTHSLAHSLTSLTPSLMGN